MNPDSDGDGLSDGEESSQSGTRTDPLDTGDNTAVIDDLLNLARCRVGGGIRSVEAAIRWLDARAVKVVLGTGLTDAAGNALPAPEEYLLPTVVMQLPNAGMITLDLTLNGIEVNGAAERRREVAWPSRSRAWR